MTTAGESTMIITVDTTNEIREDDIIIAFVGPTGTGKGYFIDLLTGQQGQRVGKSLDPMTSQILATRVIHPIYGDRVVLVDTPGFDDYTLNEKDVLQMINNWLQKTCTESVKLSGLIYLHRITDNRMAGSPLKNLALFKQVCGDDVMNRFTFVSTMWDSEEGKLAETREEELKSESWKTFIDRGSKVNRLGKGTMGSAWAILGQLVEAALMRGGLEGLERKPRGVEEHRKLLRKFIAGGRKFIAEGKKFIAEGGRFIPEWRKFIADGGKLIADGQKLLVGQGLLEEGDSHLLKEVKEMYQEIVTMFRGLFEKVMTWGRADG